MTPQELETLALAWAAADPDAGTAAEVRALVEKKDWKELDDRFNASLEFGTAGLRGVLGGGTNRMNRAVVRRTTAGLARYLKLNVPDVVKRGVVIGRDGRLMSPEFSEDTAAVLAAEGIPALVFPGFAPTPLTAFAVLHLKAAAAVMVTASHNPPEYNGYKVYWGNGAQIIPPHDTGIASTIDAVEPANEVKLLPRAEAEQQGLYRELGPEVEGAYHDAILGLSPLKQTHGLKLVYTAMHGVGGRHAVETLKRAGFTEVHPVTQQQEPDGHFPTVRFPNPEEKGAMDLSCALAEQVGADVVLANDPDADRLAVMARPSTPLGVSGGAAPFAMSGSTAPFRSSGVETAPLRMLTGNEVGVLLGHFLLTQTRVHKPLVITTIVSSLQLHAIAKALGARSEETLTGFKWIANRALALEPEGYRFVMGYEEALGYTVGTVARDKDGIGAALVVADMAAWCKGRGTTLLGYLEEVQRAHGLFVARQANFTLPGASGASAIREVMKAFRASAPTRLGDYAVAAINDYDAQTRTVAGKSAPLALPRSNVISYELDGGHRVTLRPSGTEPKIKFYFELKEQAGAGEPMGAAQSRALQKLDALEKTFIALARTRGLPG